MAKSYRLPAGWYRTTVTDLVDNTLPPLLGDLTADNTWAYVYAITMWSENVGGTDYLHIVESDRLRTQAGRDFASRAADYLREHLVPGGPCDPTPLIDQIGKAHIAERAKQGVGPPQRKRDPNVTGAAFETSLQVLIGKLCGVTPSRTPNLHTLQGFELAPAGYHSRPDLVLFGPRDFRLLISTKWTLRKERIGTYLHESYFYRRRRPDLQIAFGVNEFQTNILHHLSTDPLVNRVYHVNKRLLLDLYAPFSGLPADADVPRSTLTGNHRNAKDYRRWLRLHDNVFDLTDLIADITSLMNKPGQVLDPEATAEGAPPRPGDLDERAMIGRPESSKRTRHVESEQTSYASTPGVRSRMQLQRTRDTAPELAVRRILQARGLRYRVDRPPLKGLRRRADIVFGPAKVAVFVDGCFWHGCPEHGRKETQANPSYWSGKMAKNRERDADTDAQLAVAGWTVVRVWEHQPPLEVADLIADVVARRLGKPSR